MAESSGEAQRDVSADRAPGPACPAAPCGSTSRSTRSGDLVEKEARDQRSRRRGEQHEADDQAEPDQHRDQRREPTGVRRDKGEREPVEAEADDEQAPRASAPATSPSRAGTAARKRRRTSVERVLEVDRVRSEVSNSCPYCAGGARRRSCSPHSSRRRRPARPRGPPPTRRRATGTATRRY